MPLLPTPATEDDYAAVYRSAQIWLPALREICRVHGLDANALEMCPPSTHVVFRAGQVSPQGPRLLIKLYCRFWARDADIERAALRRLGGCLEVPAFPVQQADPEIDGGPSGPEGHVGSDTLRMPQLLADGELEGWPYAILAAVEGERLCDVWTAVSFDNRLEIVEQLGRLMRALHAIPLGGLSPLDMDWEAFLAGRAEVCLAQQAESGVSAHWLSQVEALLSHLPSLHEPASHRVLLNADITDEHVMLLQQNGWWRLSGLIDFGDAMVGHPLYEFVAPLYITRGNPRLQWALFAAYGFTPQELNEDLSRRLGAYALLHRFASIPAYLGLAQPETPQSLEELWQVLWPFGGTWLPGAVDPPSRLAPA